MRRSAAAALCVLAAAAPATASNGSAPIAIGGRAAGRGGADTAVADDPLSLTLQPAGILATGRLRGDLQDLFVVARDRFVNARNDSSDAHFGFFAPSVGIAVDPHWGEPTDLPIRLGFIATGTNGTSGSKEYATEVYPEGVEESLDFALIKTGPTIAIEPKPGLRIGFGAFFNYLTFAAKSISTGASGNANGLVRQHRTSGGQPITPPDPVEIDGKAVTWDELFAIGSSPDSNAAALFQIQESSTLGFSFNLGLQLDAGPYATFGLAYISPSFFFKEMKGTAKVDASRSLAAIQADPDIQALLGPALDIYLPGGSAATFLAEYDYTIENKWSPQVVSVGVAAYPDPRVALAADVRWMQFSETYRLTAKLTNGTSPDINEINGSDSITTVSDLNWRDIIVVAIGGTVRATDRLALRLGYNYSQNPYPASEITPGTTAFIEHHATAGASFQFTERFGGTIGIVYGIPNETTANEHDNPELVGAKFSSDQLFIYLGVSLDL